MNNRVTILYVDHTARLGGGEIALLNLIRALDKTRYRPIVVLASEGKLAGEFERSGIETHIIPLDKSVVERRKDSLGFFSFLQLRQVWRVLSYALRIARFARENDVDIIHTNSLKADIYGGIAARIENIPAIWHVRDNITADYLPRIMVSIFRLLARMIPDTVVANSQSTLRTVQLPRRAHTAVIYSGAVRVPDRDTVEDSLDAAGAKWPEEPVIALIGRISPWKGQHIFIRAAAEVVKAFPRCKFWVIGSAMFGEQEYDESIRILAEELSVKDRVEFLGFRADVDVLMPEVDIVVHASTLGEPFGQVVIEGMASAKPVIATNGGALPEIIVHDESGILVPMGDAMAMSQAIIRLLSDPVAARKMGRAGQVRVRGRFTIEHTVASMQSVYEHIIERRGIAGGRLGRKRVSQTAAQSGDVSGTRNEDARSTW
ncbi:MAG: glycosyltransferase family 4 protein [Capsulimonadaceae bacterium]|nr:glycosyltransferase family 4 protein [Capsulimonadaceae bacterium]